MVSWNSSDAELRLRGNSTLRMQELASRLRALTGTKIELSGAHQTPVNIELKRTADGVITFAAQGRIGWDSAEIAAMNLGPASIPVRVDETSVYITPTRVQAGDGHVKLAGRIRYRPGPLSIQLPAGELSHSVQNHTRNHGSLVAVLRTTGGRRGEAWMGKFDLEIDEGIIVPSDPLQHRVNRPTPSSRRRSYL